MHLHYCGREADMTGESVLVTGGSGFIGAHCILQLLNAGYRVRTTVHLRAMKNPAAKGERFLAVAGESMSIQEIALLLKAHMGNAAARAPTKVMPDWMVRLASLFNA